MNRTTTNANTPRVYVGTYAKYAAGSIKGAWLDLEDYTDSAGFHEACQALHTDEADPEFMFQDWEGIPDGCITESSLSDDLWEWLELDEYDREMVAAYRDGVDESACIEDIRDCFLGTADSARDYAEQFADDVGLLESVPDNLRGYFDFDAFARDLFLDYSGVRYNGTLYVFSNN